MKQGFQPGFEKSGKAENSATKPANARLGLGICTTFTPPPIQLGIIRGLTSFILMTLIFTLTLSCPLFAQDDSASKTKPSTSIVGDTNADGVVDITDSRNIAADLGGAPSGNHGDTDLNNDGVVNAEDCHILAQAIMDKLAESKSSKSNSSRSSELNSGETMMMDSIGSTVTLINGDATGDNVIDDFDLNEINGAFGAEGNWPTVPDMNGDGVVDDFELGMVLGNFGFEGDPVTNWSNSTASTGDYTLTIPITFGDYFNTAPGVSVYIMVKNQITGEIYNSTVTVPPTGAGAEINVPTPGLYDALVQPVNSHFLIKLEPDYQPVDNATCEDLSVSNYTCDECWTGNSALNRFLETTTETQLVLDISSFDYEDNISTGDDLRCLWDGVTGDIIPGWIGSEGIPVCGGNNSSWGFGAIFCTSDVGAKTIKSTIYDLHQNLMCNDVDKTINWTITVYPRQPIVEFIEPSASADISGIAEIKVRIKRFIGNIGPFTPVLTIQENYTHDECTSFNDEKTIQGATVTIEKENTCSQYQTETYTWLYDTTQLHNGSHTLKLTLGYPAGDCPVTTDDEMEVTRGVNVQNLVISSVTPQDLIVIKEGVNPLEITVEKQYDHGGTISATLFIYDLARNSQNYISTFNKVLSTNESIVFTSADIAGLNLQPGYYTYEVSLNETYVSHEITAYDYAYYRSEYLYLNRAQDEQGNYLTDAIYYDYDDKNTETESDDDIIFLIRKYKAYDSFGDPTITEDAGEVWFYDPDGIRRKTLNIEDLYCKEHELNDGLTASSVNGGINHSLLVPIPKTLMDKFGEYRLVIGMTDVHANCYRDHQNRKALPLNQIWSVGIPSKIRVVYTNATQTDGDNHPDYPFSSDTVNVRNIVWLSNGWIENAYCSMGYNPKHKIEILSGNSLFFDVGGNGADDVKWYQTGTHNDPPWASNVEPLHNYVPYVYRWPFTVQYEIQSYELVNRDYDVDKKNELNCSGHLYRKYEYPQYNDAGWPDWGKDNINLSYGTKRYISYFFWRYSETQEYIRLHSYAPTPGAFIEPEDDDAYFNYNQNWSRNCDEYYEYALRISVRESDIGWQKPANMSESEYRWRYRFIQWATTFHFIPYGWAQYWYRGFADNKYYCDPIPEGQGVDCSGLVSAAGRWIGLFSNKENTTSLNMSSKTDIISTNNLYEEIIQRLRPGDILVRPGHHVVIVYNYTQGEETCSIIHANGDIDGAIIEVGKNLEDFISAGYIARRLKWSSLEEN